MTVAKAGSGPECERFVLRDPKVACGCLTERMFRSTLVP
jgi:hypothetical protein